MNQIKPNIKRSFDRAAEHYDKYAVLQKEVGLRMLERLDYFKISPQWILDLGAGTGHTSKALLKRYKSSLCALDLSFNMARACKEQSQWLRRPFAVCGDAEALPILDKSMDLVFSNMTLQWVQNIKQSILEIKRVARPGACILFSTLGPDTLKELRECWAGIDEYQHVNTFLDMHHLGDVMLELGFENPVMDMEHFTLTYTEASVLMRELKWIGAHTVQGNRRTSLTGKSKMKALVNAYEAYRQDGVLPATYEVIYGHAWIPDGKQSVAVDFAD